MTTESRLRRLLGSQPELRIIIVLLVVLIALVGFNIFAVYRATRHIPEPCGDNYTPCHVVIDSQP